MAGADPAGPPSSSSGGLRPGGDDEFTVIERLRERFEAHGGAVAPGDLGIGDDAAVVTLPDGGQVVLATDLVVDGVHVDRGVSAPEDIGWKALMVTVSDLAAMGTAPDYALLSVVVPAGFPVERLAEGVAQAAEAVGCRVVGGDLSGGDVLVVSVTAVGAVPDDGSPLLRRSGAAPGDHLFATGPVGGSAAGLRLLGSGRAAAPPEGPIISQLRPVARVAEGRVARRAGASAAIDVSDGLGVDAVHLAEASGVGLALVVVDGLVAEGATRLEALTGGEDYELVVATPHPDRLIEAFGRNGLRTPLRLGRCVEPGRGITLDGDPLPAGGWSHRW